MTKHHCNTRPARDALTHQVQQNTQRNRSAIAGTVQHETTCSATGTCPGGGSVPRSCGNWATYILRTYRARSSTRHKGHHRHAPRLLLFAVDALQTICPRPSRKQPSHIPSCLTEKQAASHSTNARINAVNKHTLQSSRHGPQDSFESSRLPCP